MLKSETYILIRAQVISRAECPSNVSKQETAEKDMVGHLTRGDLTWRKLFSVRKLSNSEKHKESYSTARHYRQKNAEKDQIASLEYPEALSQFVRCVSQGQQSPASNILIQKMSNVGGKQKPPEHRLKTKSYSYDCSRNSKANK